VPEDIAVPSFVTQETWEFAQSLELEVLSGFDATAAEASVKANGFYLFHSTETWRWRSREARRSFVSDRLKC
jgi:hypothetical protein